MGGSRLRVPAGASGRCSPGRSWRRRGSLEAEPGRAQGGGGWKTGRRWFWARSAPAAAAAAPGAASRGEGSEAPCEPGGRPDPVPPATAERGTGRSGGEAGEALPRFPGVPLPGGVVPFVVPPAAPAALRPVPRPPGSAAGAPQPGSLFLKTRPRGISSLPWGRAGGCLPGGPAPAPHPMRPASLNGIINVPTLVPQPPKFPWLVQHRARVGV